jgi:ethanolamine ammonia-lyase small subunit
MSAPETPPDRRESAPITRAEIRALTQARLTFGPRGRALDTAARMRFALDYAQAREAVQSELDLDSCATQLAAAGLAHATVTSAAGTRDTFIRRPDLGRRLPPAEREALKGAGPVDVALVLGDGLSAIAAILNGPAFLTGLAARLTAQGLTLGPVVLARQARVALGDDIAQAMQARTVVMALGERPGLSAADSLGVYITHGPRAGTPDSHRNCLSNIRAEGLPVPEAIASAEALILAMRQTGKSGVALSQARAARSALPKG